VDALIIAPIFVALSQFGFADAVAQIANVNGFPKRC
jgi:hypothetical protein